jgi:hypothetical protein
MLKPFPKFKSHAVASCWNCGGDFGPNGWWSRSGYARGRGEFVQACERCGKRTWYDIQDEALDSTPKV